MLTCHACMKRCLQTLIGESPLVSSAGGSALATTSARRRHFTSETTSRRDQEIAERKPISRPLKSGNGFKNDAISTSYNRQKWLESRGVTPIHKKAERQNDDDRIKNQLRYLSDPLKLAEHVRGILREDDFESAVAVVRTASKDTQCVVSWNHLIDWQLSRGKMKGAIKTYNEMKKRAQTPDAYTYTILFRGCSEHPMPEQALTKVITIYNSMLADKSPVKPNTIHLNAVLKMCAKAQDMDALFSIASSMPKKGLRAPNNLTFTIILNAIRINAFVDLRGDLAPVQERKNRQKASRDARLLWQDITKRWRQRDIIIDEELVCTMGRVLLLGTNDDVDDIMSLIEQTMNIPRQTQRRDTRYEERVSGGRSESTAELLPASAPVTLKDPERSAGTLAQGQLDVLEANSSVESRTEGGYNLSSANTMESHIEDLGMTVIDPFKTPTPPTNVAKKDLAFFPKPGQNTLSLLMSAFLDLREKGVASKYWEIITKDYNVDPDADNYHGYLRILRQARASTETVQLLLQMPQSYMAVKTFRIAMSTCGRDRNNQHCFSNAGKVLDVMQSRLSVPDVQVLHTYLDIACSPTTYWDQQSSDWNDRSSEVRKGRQILRALHRVNPSYTNLRALFSYGDTTRKESTLSQKAELTYAVLSLTQRMISAYDILMNRSMVDKTTYKDLMKERSKLAAFITKYKHQKNALEGSSVSRDYVKESDKPSRQGAGPEIRRQSPFTRREGRQAERALA